MNTKINKQSGMNKSISLALMLCLGSVVLVSSANAAPNVDKWQSRLLFEPSSQQLELERKGRIMIYEGLLDQTVDQVLDTQFDRMQNMMFTRIVRTDSTGQPLRDANGQIVVEDDGC